MAECQKNGGRRERRVERVAQAEVPRQGKSGRQRTARAIRIGYSATQLKTAVRSIRW